MLVQCVEHNCELTVPPQKMEDLGQAPLREFKGWQVVILKLVVMEK